jgi:hypothetical protein
VYGQDHNPEFGRTGIQNMNTFNRGKTFKITPPCRVHVDKEQREHNMMFTSVTHGLFMVERRV